MSSRSRRIWIRRTPDLPFIEKFVRSRKRSRSSGEFEEAANGIPHFPQKDDAGRGAAAVAQTVEIAHAAEERKWPILEGPDTPLCLSMGDGGLGLTGMQPPAAARRRPRKAGGGYGGTLAPKPPMQGWPRTGGSGSSGEPFAGCRRRRFPWTVRASAAPCRREDNRMVAYNSMINIRPTSSMAAMGATRTWSW